jgi:RNA polymerase sigma-70 factor (ECF subfamily)
MPDVVAGTVPDAALVGAMARGDERAAAELYDRHAALVLAIALRITGERSDAEDVVVESFAQAWQQASRYEAARSGVPAWLASIARSRALDLVRARGRRERRVSSDSETVESAPHPVASPDALQALETAERDASVSAALATLPQAQRAAIELAFYEGLSHAEIATAIAAPLGTVKTRIRLGMQKLRELLGPLATGGAA